MSRHLGRNSISFDMKTLLVISVFVIASLIAMWVIVNGLFEPESPVALTPSPRVSPQVAQIVPTLESPTVVPTSQPSATPSATATPTVTPTPTTTHTPTPTYTPTSTATPTPTPTPTLNLTTCTVNGCGSQVEAPPTAIPTFDLLLIEKPPIRRVCSGCPKNEQLSETQLNSLIRADYNTLTQLRQLVLSQETYQIAPGMVYIMFNNVHHVVIDLKESGLNLRNIIPNTPKRGTLITPSYCMSPDSLLVTTADYHGLNGSNKTETGRDLFFHLGRAALYQRSGRYNIDVIRTRPAYDKTSISWGGGPLFIWNGQYKFNPEQEWFDQPNLEHYRTTHWTKLTVAISKDRKYLFVSAGYGMTLRQHAENIIELGRRWGIEVDRAMRFDGSESAYMAIRLGKYMVPILNLEEPLIVNCFAVERK
ncbi:MAG: hypothetical protein U0401_22605 [Anaerolineae bacterium]